MSLTTEYLEAKGVPFRTIGHVPTTTTAEEAEAVGVATDEVVKTLLLDTESGHAAAVIPADRRLDLRLVHEVVGDLHAHLASEPEIQRDMPEFELGALPPIGALLRSHVFVDPRVMAHDTIVFASGRQDESIVVRTQDLFEGERVTIARLTQDPADRPA